ncbi:MAG TPA: hypothetical protein VG621_00905 [Candidatus Paceibacterota bacterium]|nr:hypothetical protein [Candidatus Paceibacterota bacterium]
MKKSLISSLFIIGALAAGRGAVHAQTALSAAAKSSPLATALSDAGTVLQSSSSDMTATASGASSSDVQATPADTTAGAPSTPLALKDRTANIGTQLEALDSNFENLIDRTQTSITLLAAKNIDTTDAQIDLDAARTALALAKSNVDIFTAITVPDDTTHYDATPLKTALATIKGNFADARAHLVESLAALKASIATSLTTTSTSQNQ